MATTTEENIVAGKLYNNESEVEAVEINLDTLAASENLQAERAWVLSQLVWADINLKYLAGASYGETRGVSDIATTEQFRVDLRNRVVDGAITEGGRPTVPGS